MFKEKAIEVIKGKSTLFLIFKLLITTIFAGTIFLDRILEFVHDLRASVDEIYFSAVEASDIWAFIGTWVLTFAVLTIIQLLVPKVEQIIYKKEDKPKKKRVFWIVFIILIILWMPYILTYFPGGIFADTQQSINQCLHVIPYNNSNPFAYTMLIKVCLKIGEIFNSYQLGMNIFGILQTTTMALAIAYFIYWLYKKNFSTAALIIVTIFFGCFKLIPMYAVSIWKDTPFSIALFLYVICIAEIVWQKGKSMNNIKTIIPYVILLMAVGFLRGNGSYIVLATTIILLLAYRHEKILKFAASSIVALILVFVIQGPIFTRLGIVDPQGGWGYNAVMMSQILYVKATDGNITEEQDEIINSICKEEGLRAVYAPMLLDATTVDPSFNKAWVSSHGSEIKQLWLQLFKQNPDSYVKAHLLITLGFWDVNKVFVDAYMSNFTWPGTEEIIDFHQTDYIQQITGKSVIGTIQIKMLFSSAIFLFIMLFSMLFTIHQKRYKNLLIYLPALFTWGTIVLATPIAFSLRYVYILVLMLPLNFIIPFLENEKLKEDNKTTEKSSE